MRGGAEPPGRIVLIAALGAIAVGALVLAGWALGIDALRKLTPFADQPPVKANTVLCLVAAGGALLLLRAQPVPRWRRRCSHGLAAIVVAVWSPGATAS